MTPSGSSYSIRHLANPQATPGAAYGAAQRRILNRTAFEAAWQEITTWPGYAPTPLVPLPGLAGALGLQDVRYKDESQRFGQGSFKALGGAYAVFRLLQAAVRAHDPAARVTSAALRDGAFREVVEAVTVTCASAGNHGRSVAWGAGQFGCRCVIYVAANVDAQRVAGIAQYGAQVVRVGGTYDEAVRRAASDAARNGWHVVF